jgi:pSer/pThr/pTyr-binding forkhead associated (FHA) protein
MESSARLLLQRGLQGEREFELTHVRSTIGRSPDNDIPIADPEVSRRHAQIVRQASGYAIVDLGSTNGTFVNEVRVTALTPLQHGDQIRLGDAIDLRFFSVSSQPTVIDRPAVTPDDEDTAPTDGGTTNPSAAA